jgi:error-prone DNA polymerase
MGFYPPASLVRDAQRRGVEVLPPDVNESSASCACVSGTQGQAVRLGLDYVRSVGTDDAMALVAEREERGAFTSVGDLARRTVSREGGLDARKLEALVRSGACDRWGRRRDLLWELGLVVRPQTVQRENVQLALSLEPTAATPDLRDLTDWERMLADYAGTSVSVGLHPLTLLRPHLPAEVLSSPQLHEAPHRSHVAFAGLAIARQRPATARGIVFMLLEDEHGQVNLIVSSELYERRRAVVRGEPLLLARGRYERFGDNRNIVVDELESLGPLARRVASSDVGAALPPAHHFGHR